MGSHYYDFTIEGLVVEDGTSTAVLQRVRRLARGKGQQGRSGSVPDGVLGLQGFVRGKRHGIK
jgi:hypothetical protein